MNCGNCGVQNVEFATTCYSCGQPLGGARKILAAASPPSHTPHAPHASQPSVKIPSGIGIGLARLLFFGAVAYFLFPGPVRQIVEILNTFRSVGSGPIYDPIPETNGERVPPVEPAAPPPAVQPKEAAPEAPPPPPPPPKKIAESPPDEYPPAEAPQEINGFHMKVFEWEQTEPVHFGDVVKGRSEISGFEVSPDNRIDVTMRFTFRDPKGKVLEKSDPSRLDQPVESDTLFSSFDYAIPEKGPAGEYELEIRVDDAVSGRSVRFRRTIRAAR